jgi:hypothetical protein
LGRSQRPLNVYRINYIISSTRVCVTRSIVLDMTLLSFTRRHKIYHKRLGVMTTTMPEIDGDVDAEDCSICLDRLNTQPTQTLPCRHAFHRGCIEEWVSTNDGRAHRRCPICRARCPAPPRNNNLVADLAEVAPNATLEYLDGNDRFIHHCERYTHEGLKRSWHVVVFCRRTAQTIAGPVVVWTSKNRRTVNFVAYTKNYRTVLVGTASDKKNSGNIVRVRHDRFRAHTLLALVNPRTGCLVVPNERNIACGYNNNREPRVTNHLDLTLGTQ